MAQKASNILVVDDNTMSRKVVKFMLTKEGHNVLCANSGLKALDVLEREPVDVVFLDLLMEGMSGLDVLEVLRGDDRFRSLCVVMVSGVRDISVINECIEAGARDFLLKPVSADALKEVIADQLPLDIPPPSQDDLGATLDAIPVLDSNILFQRIEDEGRQTVDRLYARFEHYIDTQPKNLSGGELTVLRHAVSSLKGNGRMFGLSRLATVCRGIEQACDNANTANARQVYDQLPAHLDHALTALRGALETHVQSTP